MMARLALLIALLAVFASAAAAQKPDADTRRWPREFKAEDGSTLVVHQPQIMSWENHQLVDARAAIEMTVGKARKPSIGAVRFTVKTVVDWQDRTVRLPEIRLTEVVFPQLSQAISRATGKRVHRLFPTKAARVDLDRILAALELEPARHRNAELKRDPPKIILSEEDAILVLIDGKPMYDNVVGDALQAVLNSESDLFRDPKDSRYYLLCGDSWLTAPALEGPWAPADKLPDVFDRLPTGPRWDEIKKHLPGKPFADGKAPNVYVASEPTELVVTFGKPVLEPIPKTKLLFAVNTESDVFRHEGDEHYYILLSGRWFRTKGKEDPLVFCSRDLPADFAKIPENHAAGRVLASVPDTDQADEAVLAAEVPRRATVTRAGTTIQVSYEGEPEFVPVEGADGVAAAKNTSFHVYRVKGRFYCCEKGVWFEADKPDGPWKVCDKVPDEIYTIPPASPYYSDTYCYVYGSDDDSVDTGYWGGYYGCYPYDGYCWYGTGYNYRYWGRRYWRHRWNHWRPRPTPYNTYGAGRYYDHMTGRFRRSESARRHRAAREPYRGAYEGWRGEGVKPSALARGMGGKPQQMRGNRAQNRPDLYAARDGSIFRRGQDGNWQRYDRGEWRARQAGKTPGAQPGVRPKPGARPAARQRPSGQTRALTAAEQRRASQRAEVAQRSEQRRARENARAEQRRARYLERQHRSRSSNYGRNNYRTYQRSRASYRSYRGGGGRAGGGRR